MNELSLLAPAKINLCLSVLGKRPDGYHEVEMLMQAVGLFDRLTVRLTADGEVALSCDAPDVPSGAGNIAARAAREMLDRSGASVGVAISLEKNIPAAAGLGGGSSDAAAVLVACNILLGLGLGREELAETGTKLGMDVPFFLFGPTALARGRGEVLEPVVPPSPFWVLLANPGFGTSTAEVYQALKLELTKKGDCNKIARLSVGQIARSLHNDLESVTAAAHPVIREMQQALLAAGALGVRMSGSGPTVFGIFENSAACKEAEHKLSTRRWRVHSAEILTGTLYGEYLGALR